MVLHEAKPASWKWILVLPDWLEVLVPPSSNVTAGWHCFTDFTLRISCMYCFSQPSCALSLIVRDPSCCGGEKSHNCNTMSRPFPCKKCQAIPFNHNHNPPLHSSSNQTRFHFRWTWIYQDLTCSVEPNDVIRSASAAGFTFASVKIQDRGTDGLDR